MGGAPHQTDSQIGAGDECHQYRTAAVAGDDGSSEECTVGGGVRVECWSRSARAAMVRARIVCPVGMPPQSGSARMSLSKLREALESHPTTSPTPSHMAHGCIPSTAVSTDCRPLYNALQPTLFVTGSCRGSTAEA